VRSNDNSKYSHPFEAGQFFHVFNHAVGSDLLFREKENYQFFLNRYKYYLNQHIDLYAYCLLPNHFHLLIKVHEDSTNEMISEQFRKFLISYSKSFNKRFCRRGNLFEKHLKRVPVTNQEHLIWLVFYLHRNPVHHQYEEDFRIYPWSSFISLLSDKNTQLARDEVIALYSGRDNFSSFHERNITDFEKVKDLMLE